MLICKWWDKWGGICALNFERKQMCFPRQKHCLCVRRWAETLFLTHVGRAYVQSDSVFWNISSMSSKIMLLPFEIPVFLSATEICCISPLFSKSFRFFFYIRSQMHEFGRKIENWKGKGFGVFFHPFPIIPFFKSRMFVQKTSKHYFKCSLC